jgi:hypothetical protein
MGMMDAAALSKICRRAERICKKHDASLTCDVFDAGASEKFALLYPNDPPREGQVGVTVVAQFFSHFDNQQLVGELEQIVEVWRVFLTFARTHELS